MRAVILAGGFAKRLWPITWDRPKPLLPIGGKPILDYVLDLIPEEFFPVILSVNRRFSPAFSTWAKGKPVELVVEETEKEEEKLGAVGALDYLVRVLNLDEDLLVIAGDNWLRLDLRSFLASSCGQPTVALFTLGSREKAKNRYGVAEIVGNRIRTFWEKPSDPPTDLVSTGCYFFPKEVLPLFGKFLRQAPQAQDAPGYFLQWLLAQKEIVAFTEVQEWLDIGDLDSYLSANLRVTGGLSWIHPAAQVKDSRLERSVVLGPCTISGSFLVECVVDEGVRLAGVRLEKTLVGKRSWLRGYEREPLTLSLSPLPRGEGN